MLAEVQPNEPAIDSIKSLRDQADDARAYNAVLAFISPVSAPIGSTPSIMWGVDDIARRRKHEDDDVDWFPGCAFCQSTQALTIALAVSALMTAFIKVNVWRLARIR